MNILFLYTELADYTLACLRELKARDERNTITVVHFPINPEAPFQFDFKGVGNFHSITDFPSYKELYDFVGSSQPDKIVCCGWINKWYLRICRAYHVRTTCILALDNHWTGSIKQKVMAMLGRMFFSSMFHKAWVPGKPQYDYARKLGFKNDDIAFGFYACDTTRFLQLGKDSLVKKKLDFPRRLLCVARYIPAKGYNELWKAFIEWQNEDPNEWELWCVGAGEGFGDRIEHPQIKHLGFIQKDQWQPIIAQTGVFILPSHFEPWGVVVHEFAAAGFPLALSDKVGSAENFLTPSNGWKFRGGEPAEIKTVLAQIKQASYDDLLTKGAISTELAVRHSPQRWADTLLGL